MAEYTTKKFDLQKAKNGATIGYIKGNDTIIAIDVDFYENGTNMYAGCALFSDLSKLYFYDNGDMYNSDGNYITNAYIIESTITKTVGSTVTRVDDAEVFTISNLQPREEIAVQCLQSMLTKYDNPLNFDNTKIKQLVSKSYIFAQEFINQAVEYRKKETSSSTADTDKKVNVDASSLSSDTDKILYNIQVALTNWMAQAKNQYTDQQKNGLKLAATDINVKTMPESIKVVGDINSKVSGDINAAISGNISSSVSGSVSSSVSGSINATVSGSVTTGSSSSSDNNS